MGMSGTPDQGQGQELSQTGEGSKPTFCETLLRLLRTLAELLGLVIHVMEELTQLEFMDWVSRILNTSGLATT